MDAGLIRAAADLLERCRAEKVRVATAESCTGGLIAAYLTEVPGSSDVVDRGFVTYSNEAKSQQLGVSVDLINARGAVSEDVARAMAEGALGRSDAELAVAVTGIAGPGGGSAEKPVGRVHIAAVKKGGQTIHECKDYGDIGRSAIRHATVDDAFKLLASLV